MHHTGKVTLEFPPQHHLFPCYPEPVQGTKPVENHPAPGLSPNPGLGNPRPLTQGQWSSNTCGHAVLFPLTHWICPKDLIKACPFCHSVFLSNKSLVWSLLRAVTLWFSLAPNYKDTLTMENPFSQYQAFIPPQLWFCWVFVCVPIILYDRLFLGRYNTCPLNSNREPTTDQCTDTTSV